MFFFLHRFASASDDTTVIIWDTDSGEMLMKLEGHTLKVTCMLLVSSDVLITGSADKSIRISFLTSMFTQ